MTTNHHQTSRKTAGWSAAFGNRLTVLALALLGGAAYLTRGVIAAPAAYDFTLVASLGDPVPGGLTLINDFAPGAINNRGGIFSGADTEIGEGVFLYSNGGERSVLGLAGAATPGGGMFGPIFLGPVTLNDSGNGAFAFLLEPFTLPIGANSGVFRYSANTRSVSPLLLPGVTPVPGGGVFVGTQFGPNIT